MKTSVWNGTVEIKWSDADELWVARVAEIQGISTQGNTLVEAAKMAVEAIILSGSMIVSEPEPQPEPVVEPVPVPTPVPVENGPTVPAIPATPAVPGKGKNNNKGSINGEERSLKDLLNSLVPDDGQ